MTKTKNSLKIMIAGFALGVFSLSILLIGGIVGVAMVSANDTGNTPLYTQAFNRIFGQADDQNMAITLNSEPALGNVDADKVDGLHAADIQAASTSDAPMAKFMLLYTTGMLSASDGWECIDINLLTSRGNFAHIAAEVQGNYMFGGVTDHWGSHSWSYLRTPTSFGATHMCYKWIKLQ